jgi:hypothetical protein
LVAIGSFDKVQRQERQFGLTSRSTQTPAAD